MIAPDRRRILALALALVLPARAARAQEGPLPAPALQPPSPETARDFIDKLYANYRGKNPKGINLASQMRLRAIFEPELAKALSQDAKAAAAGGEAGTLDWDPFIDSHQFQVTALDVAVQDLTSVKARATVNVTNLGRETVIVVDLLKMKQGWRVFDIRWANYKTLRQLFQLH